MIVPNHCEVIEWKHCARAAVAFKGFDATPGRMRPDGTKTDPDCPA